MHEEVSRWKNATLRLITRLQRRGFTGNLLKGNSTLTNEGTSVAATGDKAERQDEEEKREKKMEEVQMQEGQMEM